MAISIQVNGNSGKEGFLLAPVGTNEFPMPVALKTTDGTTVNATLAVVAPAGVTVTLSQTTLSIGPTAKTIKITARSPSKKQGDITLQIRAGNPLSKKPGKLLGQYVLTSITNVKLHFGGRFQARFATDNDFFNEPRGTSAGWMFALEGEPDFVPSTNNVPTQPGMAVGRVVRFQNPVPLRSHVAPIGVTVKAVEGQVSTKTLTFTSGDPIIGLPCSLGANTYLAANEPIPAGAQPFETYPPGLEPMENFEFHIHPSIKTKAGPVFSGKSATLNDRPKANGFFQLSSTELTKYGVVALSTFSSQRKQQLLTDYHALSPTARTGTPGGRNLATRIGHLGGSAPDSIPATTGTLPFGWSGKETYNGNINSAVQITPGRSVVMTFFKLFQAFRYSGTLLNFHSDEQCGQVDGTLEPMTAMLARQMPDQDTV